MCIVLDLVKCCIVGIVQLWKKAFKKLLYLLRYGLLWLYLFMILLFVFYDYLFTFGSSEVH